MSTFLKVVSQVAFQINDTHPSLAIAEVMRVLIDEECLDWNRAWEIVCKTFSFTCHSVNTEGLEKIPVDLLGSLLPRHLQVSAFHSNTGFCFSLFCNSFLIFGLQVLKFQDFLF